MKEIGSFEAKTQLPQLLREVERGEQITITRRGVPVARLVPVESTSEEFEAARARILKRRQRLSLGGLKIRKLIDEGRT